MGILSKLLGSGVAETAGALGGLAVDLRAAIKGSEIDVNKKMEYSKDLILMQGEINKVEAQSSNWFVSSWRPFIGYICGLSLLYSFIVRDIIIFINPLLAELPKLQTAELMPVLLGLLGLGGLRTYEKVKGANKN